MLLTYSGNRYIVVLGRVIQYSSGEDTFSGRESPRVIISYTGGGAGGLLLALSPAHRSHANTPYSWKIPASRQGFIDLLCFIHKGRCFHLFH